MCTSTSVLTPEEIETQKTNIKKFIDENKCEPDNAEKYQQQIEIYKATMKDLEKDEDFLKSYSTILDCYTTLTTSILRPSPEESYDDIEDLKINNEEMEKYFRKFREMRKKSTFDDVYYKMKTHLLTQQSFDNIDDINTLKSLKYFMMFLLTKPDELNEAENHIKILETNIRKIDTKLGLIKQGFKKFKSPRKSKKSNKKSKTRKIKKSYRKIKKSVKSIKKRNIKH